MATPVSQHTGVAGSTAVDQKGGAGYTQITQKSNLATPVNAHSGVTDAGGPYTEIAQK